MNMNRDRMRWATLALVALALFALAGCTSRIAESAPPDSPDVMALAVGTFGDSGNAPIHIVRSLNDMLNTTLEGTKKFNLVERTRLRDLEEEYLRNIEQADETTGKKGEQGDSITYMTALLAGDSSVWVNLERGKKLRVSDEDLIKIKGLTQAEFFLLGNITDFYSEQKVKQSDSMGRTRQNSALSMTVDARLVNTKTGELVTAKTIEINEPKITGSPNDPLESRLQKMEVDIARECAKQLAYHLVNTLHPISIAKITGKKIYLNRGSNLGMKVGDALTVYTKGEEIIDPDTKKPLGNAEEIVGDIVVDEVQERLAIASKISGDVQEGMLCRATSQTGASNKEAAQSESTSSRSADPNTKTVAIMKFTNTAKAPDEFMENVQTSFYTELGDRGKYSDLKIVERQQLEKLGKEMDLTEDGYLSPATAIKIGEMTGAQYVILGSVMSLAETQKESVLRADLKKTFSDVALRMDCRLVETQKGEVFDTASVNKLIHEERSQEAVRAMALREAVMQACMKFFGPGMQQDSQAAMQPPPQGERPALGGDTNPEHAVPGAFLVISPFADATGKAPESLLQQLDTNLETQLSQTKKIPLVERTDDRYLDELVWAQAEGFVDPNKIPKTGKLVGAKYYLATKVTRYSSSAGGDDTALPNVFENHWSAGLEISAKLLAVETGQLLETFLITKSTSGQSEDKSKLTSVPNLGGVCSKMAGEAAEELKNRILDVLFPVMIADVSDTEIFLSQGASTEMKPGDRFTVFALGKAILDPQTGRSLGQREEKVGDVEVTELRREYSIAKPVDVAITSFNTGMLCRPASSKKTAKAAEKQADPPKSAPAPKTVEKTEEPKTSKVVEASKPEIPKGRVFCLAEILNSTTAPRRVEQVINGYIAGLVRKAKNTELVTRNDRELATIGQEFLRGKSRLMDKATALKTVKLTGARYVIFLELTDYVDAVEQQQVPLVKTPINVLNVNVGLYGTIVDLENGKVLSTGQTTGSSPRSEVVVDGHGDLNMQVKVAEEAADKLMGMFTDDGVFQWEGQ